MTGSRPELPSRIRAYADTHGQPSPRDRALDDLEDRAHRVEEALADGDGPEDGNPHQYFRIRTTRPSSKVMKSTWKPTLR